MALFQPGNQLGTKTKVIDGMIRSVLALDDRQRLRTAVEKQLELAAEGNLASLDWLACRLEGKAAQAIQTDDEGRPVVAGIQLVVIKQEQLPNVIKDIPSQDIEHGM